MAQKPNRLELYRQMVRARSFELALADLWKAGHISGELHLGTGEEAVAAGTTAHLREGDAVALDHRGTPVLLLLGVDPLLILRELVGSAAGLCGGRGGHMHLMSRAHLAAASGIVGASGPMGAGFALALERQRRGAVAVSFFGDGALNQGQLLESMNLAVAWKLPQLFVCKDNKWAITTDSSKLTGGTIAQRAEGFGLPVESADGLDVEAVYDAMGRATDRARRGRGPTFLWLRCSRLDGHVLGDQVIRLANAPLGEGELLSATASGALTPGGGGLGARMRSMARMTRLLVGVRADTKDSKRDPLTVARRALRGHDELDGIESAVVNETLALVARLEA